MAPVLEDYNASFLAASDASRVFIKVKENVLDIKGYYFPWDVVFDNVKIDLSENNLYPFQKLSSTGLKRKEYYSIFYTTTFQRSIAAFWVKDIVAYILKNILKDGFKNLEEIVDEAELLLKKSQIQSEKHSNCIK